MEDQFLKLGLTFCPDSDVDRFTIIKDIHLFAPRLVFKTFYDKPTQLSGPIGSKGPDVGTYTLQKLRAIDDLMELWEKSQTELEIPLDDSSLDVLGGVTFPPPFSFKPKSRNFPLLNNNHNIWAFVQQTTQEIEKTTW